VRGNDEVTCGRCDLSRITEARSGERIIPPRLGLGITGRGDPDVGDAITDECRPDCDVALIRLLHHRG
jgi:hypothetical protein